MSLSKLTMISFYQHLNNENDNLFKHLSLPTGIDKATLINNILLEGADFEVLYSNPYFMQDAIKVWSQKWYRTFEKWNEALNIEYNPLENYDRKEDWEDENKSTSNRKDTTTGHIAGSDTGTSENKKSAYDSNLYEPYEQIQASNSNTSDSNAINTSDDKSNSATNHSGRIHGNIGVTTSQQMLQSELDIAEWNLYKHITDLFIDEFCIQIYI